MKNKNGKKKFEPQELQFTFNAIIESIDKATGKVKQKTEVHNIVVNDGLSLVRNWMAGDAVDNPTAIAVGTDATAPAVGDTALGTEVVRESATITKPASYQVRYEKVFSVGSGVSHNIREVGIVDNVAVSGSTLFSRIACNNTLDADTDLSVKVTYTIGRA